MKELFLIIYVLAKAAIGFGPLPYGMDVCLDRSKALREAIDKDFDEGTSPFQEMTNKKEDVTLSCKEMTYDEFLKMKEEAEKE